MLTRVTVFLQAEVLCCLPCNEDALNAGFADVCATRAYPFRWCSTTLGTADGHELPMRSAGSSGLGGGLLTGNYCCDSCRWTNAMRNCLLFT